jgi:hypothetical protein
MLLPPQVAVLVSAGYGTSNNFGYTDITRSLYGNCQGSGCSFNVATIAAAQVRHVCLFHQFILFLISLFYCYSFQSLQCSVILILWCLKHISRGS